MNSEVEVSIVVPVFRGETTIGELFQRIKSTMLEIHKTFEIIFVHDGGSLASWQEAQNIQKANPIAVKAIKLAKNYGQNAATLCGIAQSNGTFIITIDEDLQSPPETIKNLIEAAQIYGFDLVYGVPEKGKQSAIRRFGSYLIKRFFRSIEGLDIGSSFRLIKRDLANRIHHPQAEHIFINQVVNWYTDKIGFVTVKAEQSKAQKSGYSFLGLAGIALRLIVFYSDFLLRLMIYMGLIISISCLALGSFFIYNKLTIGAELGFTSVIVAIFFSTGIIITCFSIVGLYIQRIFKTQLRRPVYSIEQILK